MRTLEEAMKKFRLINGVGDGAHEACVMSVAGWLGQGHKKGVWNDDPLTVCPRIRGYLVALNDFVKDKERELLWPFAKKALHTETLSVEIEALRNKLLRERWLEFRRRLSNLHKLPDGSPERIALIKEFLTVVDEAIQTGSCVALAVKEKYPHGTPRPAAT